MDFGFYIILVKTQTWVSRIIGKITGGEFTHVALALDSDLRYTYAFGRKYPYMPLPGGFVCEKSGKGTFRRFPDAAISVIKISISEKKYNAINEFLDNMHENKRDYKYNFRGLFMAYFGRCTGKEDHYYCSEFVKMIVEKFDIVPELVFPDITKPMDIYHALRENEIYKGLYSEYIEEYNT